ncbi:unnamed protein product [Lathyrus oleraceus]
MTDQTLRHYVRVIVEFDLSQTLSYKVLVERKNFAFFMEMNYKNLLAFCSHLNMIGHDLESCLKVTSKKTDVTHQQDQPKPRVEPKQKFIQVAYKRHQPDMRDGNDPILEVIPKDNAIDNKAEHTVEP